MPFKSSYSWMYLILGAISLLVGISGLLDSEPDILGLRDSLAWVVVFAGVFCVYQFVSVTFKAKNTK